MRPKPGGPEARLVETLKTFFHHPLGIFGRQYRPFCQKDGAMIYWCERGPGLKTIPLVSFCQKVHCFLIGVQKILMRASGSTSTSN
jgi:hypothetical protein